MRKSAKVEKRRCDVARAAFNINGTEDGYTGLPTAALHRVSSRCSPSQSSHGVISERHQFSQQEQASIRFAVNLVRGKWKIGILCRLQEGPARLGDLRRLFPAASKKMLTQHLRQMERDGLIIRTDLSERVPCVEYSLSNSLRVAVVHLIDFLAQWGGQNLSPKTVGMRPGTKPKSDGYPTLKREESGVWPILQPPTLSL